MRIDVNVNEIKVAEDEILNKNEYMIHDFYFNFSEEYTNDLVKVALFTTEGGTTYKVLLDIHDSCNIPPEILANESVYVLGVYAYKTEDDELVKRFSPSPIKLYVNNGSYIRDEDTENSEPITPSELEQYQQIIENALNEVANVDIDAEKIGDTATVTITNRYGEEKSVSIIDGKDGIDGKDAKINGYNTITIEGGENISIEQEGNTLTINNDYEYDDSEIKQDIETIEGNIVDINTELGTKVTKDVNNLTYYTLTTQTGSRIQLEINSSTYVLTAKLYDKNNNLISTSSNIDLPLETMVVGASYDSTTKEIVLTLKNGQTTRFSVADLVSGLQTEITSDNKLSADLVDDSTSTNKFVTSAEKTQISTNSTDISNIKNGTTIDSFGDVESALGNKEDISNKSQTLDNSTTKYPSNKAVKDSQDIQDSEIAEMQEILSNIPTTTGTGEEITIDNTMKCKHVSDELGGNTSQETTSIAGGDEYDSPSPEHPSNVNVVKGENEVVVSNKNLCLGINQNAYLNNAVNQCGVASGNSGLYIKVNGETYTISTTEIQTRYRVACTSLEPSATARGAYNGQNKDNTSNSITINTSGYNYLVVNATDLSKIQIEKNSTATAFQPHAEQNYPISLGSIELAKIGSYQDKLFKAISGDVVYDSLTSTQKEGLTSGSWYKYGAIGKVVLNGTETWTNSGTNSKNFYYMMKTVIADMKSAVDDYEVLEVLSNYFSDGFSYSSLGNSDAGTNGICVAQNHTLTICNSSYNKTQTADFKTWLSTHNTIVYYVLATPTFTEITDTTLITQLENWRNSKSYQGQTNISQTNDDKVFVISYTTLKDVYAELDSRLKALES